MGLNNVQKNCTFLKGWHPLSISISISIFSKITISISISISIFLELPYRYRYFSELPYRYRYFSKVSIYRQSICHIDISNRASLEACPAGGMSNWWLVRWRDDCQPLDAIIHQGRRTAFRDKLGEGCLEMLVCQNLHHQVAMGAPPHQLPALVRHRC